MHARVGQRAVGIRTVLAVLASAGLALIGGPALSTPPALSAVPPLAAVPPVSAPAPAPLRSAPLRSALLGSAPRSAVVPYDPTTGPLLGTPELGAAAAAVVAHGRPGQRRIALTFDSNMTDAMLRRLDAGTVDSYANPAVVDELQRRDVPATFFLAGRWVQRYPELTRRIAADPRFELASHSYSHRGFTAHCYRLEPIPAAEMAADVERSFALLAPFSGRLTRYFRFPGGCYDAEALRAIAPAGATVVQYDDVGGDPFAHDPAMITANVLRQAHDGAIVVLHITKGNAPRTADALPGIVDGLRALGYRLVTLSELLR